MASEKSGRPLFLGSYPITPATDILHELAKRKDLGVKACQMEDEIAGVCSAIGASFAGSLGVTSTSGPGLALKGEAIGLAVMAELPLVVIDVQRGGRRRVCLPRPNRPTLTRLFTGATASRRWQLSPRCRLPIALTWLSRRRVSPLSI